VVGTEVNSRSVYWDDRSTCILFGDGAVAVVLESANEPGIMSTHIHSDVHYQDLLYLPNPSINCECRDESRSIRMQGS
ncbi:3-oxoacyl-ACP synthase, partial [Methylococcus sp. S2T]